MKKTLALILAGGKGKRMKALCQTRPKPLLPFAGSYCVIDFTLSSCARSGVQRIAALLDYRKTQLASYLLSWQASTSAFPGLDILEPGFGSFRGTADAVYQRLGYLAQNDVDQVLILAGDHVYNMDYREMIAFHRDMNAEVTIGVARVPYEQTNRFGTVLTDSESRITSFVEKAPNSPSNLASMGIYVFNKQYLIDCLIEDAGRPYSTHDFGFAIIPGIVRKGGVCAFEFEDYWQDIGTYESYFNANMDFLNSPAAGTNFENWALFNENEPELMAEKVNTPYIRNSLISPGCVIDGLVVNSILSPGVRVGEHAIIRDSILMSDVNIGYHGIVDHCIIDEKVSVAPHSSLGNGYDIVPITSIIDFRDQDMLTRNYH